MDDLKVGNLGGKVWSKIKHSNEVPEFSRMAEARVWKEAGFNSLRTHLKSKAQEAKAELRTRLETEKGSVMQAAVRLGPEGQEKILGCGKLGGLTCRQKIDVIWAEGPMTEEDQETLISFLELKESETTLVLFGPAHTVEKFADASQKGPEIIHVFCREEPDCQTIGIKEKTWLNAEFICAIFSPKPLLKHRTYLASDTVFRVSFISYILSLLDLPSGAGLFQHLLYLPLSTRKVDSVIHRTARFLCHG